MPWGGTFVHERGERDTMASVLVESRDPVERVWRGFDRRSRLL
jgi:hypothetical protein